MFGDSVRPERSETPKAVIEGNREVHRFRRAPHVPGKPFHQPVSALGYRNPALLLTQIFLVVAEVLCIHPQLPSCYCPSAQMQARVRSDDPSCPFSS